MDYLSDSRSMASALRNIVMQAGDAVLAMRKDISVSAKGNGTDRDLVTSADLASEELIISKFHRIDDTIPIIAEENSPDGTGGSLDGTFFVTDPIDGTINFANGIPMWGIQVAFVSEGKTMASAINLPDLRRLYVADSSGAYMNGSKISVSPKKMQDGLYTIEGKDRLIGRTELITMGFPHLREHYSTCTSYAFVSSGNMIAAAHLCNHPWDWIPGELLVRQAGDVSFDDNAADVHIVANTMQTLGIMRSALC